MIDVIFVWFESLDAVSCQFSQHVVSIIAQRLVLIEPLDETWVVNGGECLFSHWLLECLSFSPLLFL